MINDKEKSGYHVRSSTQSPNLLNKYCLQAKSAFYLLLLIVITPFCLVLTICASLFGKKNKDHKFIEKSQRRTVLVSGVVHTKGLHVAKTLAKAGHRVIAVDGDDFWCAAARWSRFVSKFYTVPTFNSNSNNEEYINGIINIAESENIDWYVPVSHTKSAIADTIIKQRLTQRNSRIKCLVYDDPKLTAILDDKVLFLEECQKLELRVPDFKPVKSVNQVREIAEKGLFIRDDYFLKPLMPHSADRLRFTRIPSNEEELEKYLASYESKLDDNSYLVNRFIKGKEFIANAICIKGRLQAFHVSPSSPMQIDFDVVQYPEIRKWVKVFCNAKQITGFICFDFVEDETSRMVYCIECNPRLNSTVVSYRNESDLERAIRGALEPPFELEVPVEPPVSSPHVYWLYNEIAKVALFQQDLKEFVHTVWTGKDAVFDTSDPLPFFMLNHFQMPVLLFRALISGQRWNVTNYCLGQLR